jgi:quinol monooxygenase YgiN
MKAFGRIAVKCFSAPPGSRSLPPRKSTSADQEEPGDPSMIYVVATSQVKPESRDAFIKGAKECIAATRKEKGCLSYESHTSINDPNLFVVVERWETREDLNAHGRAPHMKVWREYSAPLKVSPTVIEIISDGKVEKL